jgi:signal transduction histidine kinase
VLAQHSKQIGDGRAIGYLGKMDKQINKLTELIYDLLNISKLQAGRMEFNERVFDFGQVVKEVVDVMQQSNQKHKLIINGTTKMKVYGDDDRIGQVISNLVSNATKYSPHSDRVIIHLWTKGKKVQLGVEDFGIGISEKHLHKIFERFYRVYDTTDKTFPGLGIGLYICSEIVKRHKGKLWVESNEGKGSTFYFTLPIYDPKK